MQNERCSRRFIAILLVLSAFVSFHVAIPGVATPEQRIALSLLDQEQKLAPASVESVFSHFRGVAAGSDYVHWIEHGKSPNGHPLGYAIVGTPERLGDLDHIREDMSFLGDPRIWHSRRDRGNLLKTMPAVVWITCSVHGHELAPADAACRLVSFLASDTSAEAHMIRDSLLVLIDPLRNPDGRERALAQRRQWRSEQEVIDDESFHHRSLWPGGRQNHYLIDPNRDAWQLTQEETRLRALEIIAWQPQVVMDLHEMQAYDTYLFSPPGAPFPSFIPCTTQDWWDRFSGAIARAMTLHGTDYYHGDWHEAFAPDRFVAWSLRTGATGILLEVPGVDGTAVEQPDGAILTFKETVNRHLVATMAILETAAVNRKRLLEDFSQFRKSVVAGDHLAEEGNRIALCGRIEDRVLWLPTTSRAQIESAASPAGQSPYSDAEQRHECLPLGSSQYRSVLLPLGPNESRRLRAARILAAQGIEIGITQAALKRPNAKSALGETRGNEPFPAGTFVIDLYQPLGALAASLLDPVPAMEESTLLAERRSLVETEESMISQYSAWSLPLWADTEAWYEKEPVAVEQLPAESFHKGGNESAGLGLKKRLLEQWTTSHAFLLNASDDATLHATLRLLESGITLRAAAVEFGARGISFEPGTIIIPARNRNEPTAAIEQCLKVEAIPISIDLALTDYGTDLGGRKVVPVKAPRIALLTGFGTSAMAMGRLWFLFDKEMTWPVSLLPIQNIDSADLTAYNVMILPDAPVERGRRLREIIGSESWKRLLNWISFGGTLVLCGESTAAISQAEGEPIAHFAIRRELLEHIPQLERQVANDLYSKGFLESTSTGYWKPTWLSGTVTMPEEAATWDARIRRFSPRGVFLRLDVDTDHWLVAGMSGNACIPVETKQAYHALYPADTIARFERGADLCAAGLLWPEARKRWEASDALMREKIGSGQLIAIAGDFKHGSPVLDRLILNAAILGPTFVKH